ncbi:MAG: ATP synthase F1 subunit gamma [Vulcanimicrobiota bacterium]
MSSIRDLKRRIKSVRNIQQITKAMKMVAAARIRKAEEQLKAARPYAEKLKEVVTDLTSQMEDILHPLMESRPVKRVAYLVVSSDKGLCGAYNNNLLRMAWRDLSDENGLPHDLIAVGAKVNKYLARRKVQPTVARTGWSPDFVLAQELADTLSDWFINEQVDQVVVFYTRAVSAMTQEPLREVILPLTNVADADRAEALPYEFEPSAEVALNILLPRYLRMIIYKILMEAKVSELGSRLKAMSNATDNADKLAGELTLEFFRLRQESITREILEISGGAEALKASS